jgi:hypothetical protein
MNRYAWIACRLDGTMLHVFICETDLALTYALRRPMLARACVNRALTAALELRRPDLVYQANALLGVL